MADGAATDESGPDGATAEPAADVATTVGALAALVPVVAGEAAAAGGAATVGAATVAGVVGAGVAVGALLPPQAARMAAPAAPAAPARNRRRLSCSLCPLTLSLL